jgi:hypothetical protein
MRTLRLARVAAEAEGLLLRRRLRGIAIRAGLAAVAGLFAVGALALLHVYAWLRLDPLWGPENTTLAIAGFDAAVAIVVALFALRTPTDRIAASAAAVRDQALSEMRNVFTVTSMLKPLTGILFEQWMMRRGRKKKE